MQLFNMIKIKYFFAGLLLLLAFNVFADEITYEMYFAKVENVKPADQIQEFGCSDKVYAIINLKGGVASSKVKSQLQWITPNGKVQEQTDMTFYVNGVGDSRAWAWLQLHGPSAILGFLDDSSGMQKYLGDWDIRLLVDGKVVIKGQFNMLC